MRRAYQPKRPSGALGNCGVAAEPWQTPSGVTTWMVSEAPKPPMTRPTSALETAASKRMARNLIMTDKLGEMTDVNLS